MNYNQIKHYTQDEVESVLDIGAHFGEFTKQMRKVYPFASFHMIEANESCSEHLSAVGFVPFDTCLLSDQERIITYFKNKSDETSTGNSYYKELSEHFSDQNIMQVEMKACTLDNMFPTQTFDLIKLDTQGSELDILIGGQNLVTRSKFLIIECSVEPYNENAPTIDQVINYVKNIDFIKLGEIGDHYINGRLTQQDIIFKKQ